MLLLSRRKALLYLGSGSVGFLGSCLFGCRSTVPDESALSSKIETKGEPIDLIDQIKRLKSMAPSKNSYQYRPPKTSELEQFRNLANAVDAGNIEKAGKLAQNLNYRLIKFREQSTQQMLLGLLENKDQRGWGSYFLNPSARAKALVESPHILFDRFTPEMAGQVFLLSKARGFLMGGAHRNANGLGSADVCDPIGSVFQVVHESWSQDGANTWQLHGFSNPIAKGFPENTEIVLSTGTANVSQATLRLEKILEEQGFSSYVYNELSPESAMNQNLNEQVPGTAFSPLAGTENVQGIYNRQFGVPFLHIEIESDLRSRKNSRAEVARAIAEAIGQSS